MQSFRRSEQALMAAAAKPSLVLGLKCRQDKVPLLLEVGGRFLLRGWVGLFPVHQREFDGVDRQHSQSLAFVWGRHDSFLDRFLAHEQAKAAVAVASVQWVFAQVQRPCLLKQG